MADYSYSQNAFVFMVIKWRVFKLFIIFILRYLVSPSSNGDRHVLSEGHHEFEFKFRLPVSSDMATSMEGKFGLVRYFVRVDLDQSWAFTHRAKRVFTVISPVDVNTVELLVWKKGRIANG